MNMAEELLNYPFVSVIVITKDRRDDLKKAIQSLRELDYPQDKFEIVIVEEGDEPQKIEGVKYVFIPRLNKGFGYARNIGIKNAKGEIIAFTDDDCIVDKNWLKELAKPFQDNEIMGVAGGVLVKDCNLIGYAENVLGFPNGGLMRIHNSGGKAVETKELSTCNCAYRKEVFEKLGLFREDTKYSGEDYEFAKRVVRNYKCVFYPKAIVYHKSRGSLIKIFKWFTRRGINEWFVGKWRIKRIQEHIFYNLQASLLVKVIIIILIFNIFEWNKYWLYIAVPIVWYSILLLKYKWQLAYHIGWRVFFLTPLVKWVMDSGMDFGRLIGGFILWKNLRSMSQ